MDITRRFTACSWRELQLLERIWYEGHPLQWLLWPLSVVFGLLASTRRLAYRLALIKSTSVAVPVIVVGNISVGGTGKTPLTIWLINHLRQQGWKPGIVSRGYGGKSDAYPLMVSADSDPAVCGDEPVLMARRCACPVMVDPQRVRGAQALLDQSGIDIIVSDDGLQHYALGRDIELVVVDAKRRFGNRLLLPAGPLREPVKRVCRADACLVNGAEDCEAGFILQSTALSSVIGDREQALDSFSGQHVHAIAGIGNPERFFHMLEAAGLSLVRHAFADHHAFSAPDIDFSDGLPVLMTEKDAVKCRSFAGEQHWYLPVEASPNKPGLEAIQRALQKLKR